MGADSDKECCDAMRQRIIPKLILTEKSEHAPEKTSIEKDAANENKETNEERVKRISHTNVSFMEFWMQCIDWNMLRLFFGLLMLFFFAVGFTSLLYLMFVFSFKENLWYYYFPVSNKEEL
eukprot:GFUD01045839.1.p2 GENE.GFUD01045839.1~~GFUD01045839.1.p2  ORF type:complete len:121 (-),score=30.77 GFUD01045839.1:586-948(-)